MPSIIVPKNTEFRIRKVGNRVHVVIGGKLVADIDWKAADVFAAALRAKARRCEEEEKAEKIVLDSAIMLRAGAPYVLSDRQDIKDAAANEAAFGSIRRYMRSIPSQEKFGHPVIEVLPPKPKPTEPTP